MHRAQRVSRAVSARDGELFGPADASVGGVGEVASVGELHPNDDIVWGEVMVELVGGGTAGWVVVEREHDDSSVRSRGAAGPAVAAEVTAMAGTP
jgi:hypothetical protein